VVNSKQKGKRGEREVAHLLRLYGFDGRRGVQYSGSPDSPDVVGLPGWHIEVKLVERLNVYEAWKQATRESGEDQPLLFHRRSRSDWLVTLDGHVFLTLLRSWADFLRPLSEIEGDEEPDTSAGGLVGEVVTGEQGGADFPSPDPEGPETDGD